MNGNLIDTSQSYQRPPTLILASSAAAFPDNPSGPEICLVGTS